MEASYATTSVSYGLCLVAIHYLRLRGSSLRRIAGRSMLRNVFHGVALALPGAVHGDLVEGNFGNHPNLSSLLVV